MKRDCKETRIIIQEMHNPLASLFEGGARRAEGVFYRMRYTPPVSFADSPLKEGAKDGCILFWVIMRFFTAPFCLLQIFEKFCNTWAEAVYI